MKTIFSLLLVSAALACSNPEKAREEILATDREFSHRSAEKGLPEAFLFYADDNLIKPSEGSQPVFGKEALRSSLQSAGRDGYQLTWEPLRADVSGDLGYTFGVWTRQKINATPADSIRYGNYVTIWKRQPDGSWKWVLDTGNGTPAATTLPK